MLDFSAETLGRKSYPYFEKHQANKYRTAPKFKELKGHLFFEQKASSFFKVNVLSLLHIFAFLSQNE